MWLAEHDTCSNINCLNQLLLCSVNRITFIFCVLTLIITPIWSYDFTRAKLFEHVWTQLYKYLKYPLPGSYTALGFSKVQNNFKAPDNIFSSITKVATVKVLKNAFQQSLTHFKLVRSPQTTTQVQKTKQISVFLAAFLVVVYYCHFLTVCLIC